MSGTIQMVGGVAQIVAGAQGMPSFPIVTASLVYSADAYDAFPTAVKIADGSGYLAGIKGGASHVGVGSGRILFSGDFVTWTLRSSIPPIIPADTCQSTAICQHPDGRIIALTRHFTYGVLAPFDRVQYSSDNGSTWTSPAEITGLSGSVFSTTRHGSEIYLTAYDNVSTVNLYRFTGDTTVELIANIGSATANSEAAICVRDDGEMIAHIRLEPNGATSTIRSASPPYTSWTTRGTWHPWHGQTIRKAPDGTLWGVGRWFLSPSVALNSASPAITAVVRYDGYTPRVVAYLPPSSQADRGNVGYGDLVWIGAEEYPRVIYYAPGGTTCAIYTATITDMET